MNENERFVKSIYPNAFVDATPSGRPRICSEPTIMGFWLGGVCDKNDQWQKAAEYIRWLMVRKLEK